MCITFSIKHTVFALVVRHSDLVRNDFLVEEDNRVIIDKQPRVQQAWFLGLIGLRNGQSVQPNVMRNVQTPFYLRLKGPAEVYASAVVTQ